MSLFSREDAVPGPPDVQPPAQETLDALNSIKSTPYANSFASRLYGTHVVPKHTFGIDWDCESVWMQLMEDIRLHSALRLGQPFQETANRPVVYTCLEAKHLNQVHQLLEASFWPGIDISSSLEWEPERSTVVAVYKSYLVVGVALITEPQEMYITYLAVRPGWRACGIATRMLYHLLQFNEWKDVSLHVSANNNAMLLYNLFGFKIEEFITNFYQNYLPPDDVSKESKNAFRLRLRR